MKRFCILFAACLIAIPATAMAEKPIPKDPLMMLQGSWNIVSGINQGKELTDEELKGSYAVVEKNTIVTYDRDKNETYRAEFTLTPSTEPTQIDMTTIVRGKQQGEALGITKIGQTNWKLCYALPGEERPKKFESAKGSRTMLFELEKIDVPSNDPEVE